MPNKNGRLTDLRNAVLLCWIIGLAFLPVLGAQFIYWDDDAHVFENPLVSSAKPSDIIAIFQTAVNKTYIPLTTLSFNIEHRFFGFNAFHYHLDNLILHILVCILLYAFARRLGFDTSVSFLSALIFGIHPMHVESIAWVTQRKDVLYSLFYLLALYSYWNYLISKRWLPFMVAMAAGLLSILAKPMALSLPLTLLALDWYKTGTLTRVAWLRAIPFAAIIWPIAWITYHLNARGVPITNGWESFLIWSWTASFYLKKFFTPFVLLPLYQLPQPITLWNFSYLSGILVLIGFLFSMFFRRKDRLFLFACLFYILSTFFLWRYDTAVDTTIVGDRFMYLPSLGICLWLASLIGERLKPAHHQRRFALPILIAVILFMTIKTSSQCRVWKDDMSVWNYVIGHKQELALPYNSRAVALSKLKEKDLAFEDFKKALDLNPKYAFAYYNRGKLHASLGHFDLAIEDFNRSIAINPLHWKTLLERGIVFSKRNELARALEDFNTVLSLNKNDFGAYNNRGITFKKMGNLEAALEDYNRALALNPSSVQAYINRGNLQQDAGNYKEALNDLRQAHALGLPIDRARIADLENRPQKTKAPQH